MSDDISHLADLKPDPKNARRHTPRNVGTIVDAMHEVGAARSIVIDDDGTILAGNATVEAAAEAGIERVRVVDADGEEIVAVRRRGLTPEQKTRLALFDNRASELADWDPDVLASLADDGVSFDGLFTEDELADLVADADGAGTGGLTDPDEVPEPPEEPVTKRGDVIRLGHHRLMCGDATAVTDIERLVGATELAVLFDPPYDAATDVLSVRWPCRDALVFTDARHLLDTVSGWPGFRCLFCWDGQTSWYTPGWPLARGKFCMWFGESEYDPDGSHYGDPDLAHTVTNTRGSYRYRPDPRGKHLSTVFQSPATRQFNGHAHAKPVDWVRMLIANCTRRPILDLFAGSGTSVIACEQLDRPCFALELSPAQCDVIVERWERFSGRRAERSTQPDAAA